MRIRNLVIGMVLLITGVVAGIFIGHAQSEGEEVLVVDAGMTAVIVAKVDIPAHHDSTISWRSPRRHSKRS